MKYKYIIWDFNGTLLEDVSVNLEVLHIIMKENNIPCVNMSEYKDIFSFPAEELYRKLGFDFEVKPFKELAKRYFELYPSMAHKCTLQPGIIDTLEMLNSSSTKQVILSASPQDLLLKQANDLGIEKYFESIMGISNIYAASKVEIALKWLNENKLNPEELLFIGDTTHDYEVSLALGCDCILFDRGHQSHKVLSKCGVPVMHDIDELVNYV